MFKEFFTVGRREESRAGSGVTVSAEEWMWVCSCFLLALAVFVPRSVLPRLGEEIEKLHGWAVLGFICPWLYEEIWFCVTQGALTYKG